MVPLLWPTRLFWRALRFLSRPSLLRLAVHHTATPRVFSVVVRRRRNSARRLPQELDCGLEVPSAVQPGARVDRPAGLLCTSPGQPDGPCAGSLSPQHASGLVFRSERLRRSPAAGGIAFYADLFRPACSKNTGCTNGHDFPCRIGTGTTPRGTRRYASPLAAGHARAADQ